MNFIDLHTRTDLDKSGLKFSALFAKKSAVYIISHGCYKGWVKIGLGRGGLKESSGGLIARFSSFMTINSPKIDNLKLHCIAIKTTNRNSNFTGKTRQAVDTAEIRIHNYLEAQGYQRAPTAQTERSEWFKIPAKEAVKICKMFHFGDTKKGIEGDGFANYFYNFTKNNMTKTRRLKNRNPQIKLNEIRKSKRERKERKRLIEEI